MLQLQMKLQMFMLNNVHDHLCTYIYTMYGLEQRPTLTKSLLCLPCTYHTIFFLAINAHFSPHVPQTGAQTLIQVADFKGLKHTLPAGCDCHVEKCVPRVVNTSGFFINIAWSLYKILSSHLIMQ